MDVVVIYTFINNHFYKQSQSAHFEFVLISWCIQNHGVYSKLYIRVVAVGI